MDQDNRCRSGAFDADQRTKLNSLFILISLLSIPRSCPEGEAFLLRNASRQDMARRVLNGETPLRSHAPACRDGTEGERKVIVVRTRKLRVQI
jgi:hypothetical protein